MKIRFSFVSNSSSQSFVVYKDKITLDQIEAIKNHITYAKQILEWEPSEYDFEWIIEEKEKELIGDVSMNNFDMETFFDEIELPAGSYEFSDEYF